MRRRGVTILVGCVLLLLLGVQIVREPVPYVELGPGPTYDTLGSAGGKQIIEVDGAPTSKSAGQLRLVTVSVQPDMTLLDAVRGWFSGDVAVVPRELIYPPDMTEQQVDDANERDFKESQTSAETAALRELGYPVEVTVTQVSDGFPAAGVLAVGDVITEVDGAAITSDGVLRSVITTKPAGEQHQVVVRRGGQSLTLRVGTAKGDDGAPRLGVGVESKQPHPFTMKIDLDRIGGPSAGLMFALGIVDLLRPADLTGGNIIVGTGTIDNDGKVGPIGGIQQKLVAAKMNHAKVFLTPADNCAEALAAAQPGLPLVKVSTLHDALDALQALREHRTLPLCGG